MLWVAQTVDNNQEEVCVGNQLEQIGPEERETATVQFLFITCQKKSSVSFRLENQDWISPYCNSVNCNFIVIQHLFIQNNFYVKKSLPELNLNLLLTYSNVCMYYYLFIYTKDCCSKLFVRQNVRRKNELYLLVEKQNFKLPNRLDLDQSKH